MQDSDPWTHRMDGMRCKTCIWFEPKTPGGAGSELRDAPPPKHVDLGRCRRRAPTMDGFPAVFVNDWCGDHKLDENKL